MLLNSQEYSYTIVYTPGKDIPVADALSRAPTDNPVTYEVTISNVSIAAFNPDRLDRIHCATSLDTILQEVDTFIMEGWPNDKGQVSDRLLQLS